MFESAHCLGLLKLLLDDLLHVQVRVRVWGRLHRDHGAARRWHRAQIPQRVVHLSLIGLLLLVLLELTDCLQLGKMVNTATGLIVRSRCVRDRSIRVRELLLVSGAGLHVYRLNQTRVLLAHLSGHRRVERCLILASWGQADMSRGL